MYRNRYFKSFPQIEINTALRPPPNASITRQIRPNQGTYFMDISVKVINKMAINERQMSERCTSDLDGWWVTAPGPHPTPPISSPTINPSSAAV